MAELRAPDYEDALQLASMNMPLFLKAPLIFALLALLPPPIHAEETDNALASRIGRSCTVRTRNDIYATESSSNESLKGVLRVVSKDWIMIESYGERWIPRNVIYLIDFPPKE
jgi:hypothetical protein